MNKKDAQKIVEGMAQCSSWCAGANALMKFIVKYPQYEKIARDAFRLYGGEDLEYFASPELQRNIKLISLQYGLVKGHITEQYFKQEMEKLG